MVSTIESGIRMRPGEREESAQLAADWYAAFSTITAAQGYPRNFKSQEEVEGLMETLLDIPSVYSMVAEFRGEPVGAAFLWQGEEVAGIGPVFVRPALQGGKIGRCLIESAIRQSDRLKHRSTRLTQATYNLASMALYAKLGFEVREPLIVMQGLPPKFHIPGYNVREARMEDLDRMDDLCQQVHGHRRTTEIAVGIGHETARVCEVGSSLVGYTTDTGYLGHTVGRSNEAIYAILGAAEALSSAGINVPTRNAHLFKWCLDRGLKSVFPSTLMVKGWYQEPKGAFLPSALF